MVYALIFFFGAIVVGSQGIIVLCMPMALEGKVIDKNVDDNTDHHCHIHRQIQGKDQDNGQDNGPDALIVVGSQGIIVLCMPMAMAALHGGPALALFILLMSMNYVAMQISPVHICLTLFRA